MPEQAAVTLSELVGRPVAEVKEALARRSVQVETVVDAIGGPLALLVPPTSAPAVPEHGRVVAYTSADRVTRFVVDEAGSLRGELTHQTGRLEEMEKRLAALEQTVARLSRSGGTTAAERPQA
jgi:hypothetical protein